MSIEIRVEKLETDVIQLRKMMHQKDEHQHKIWNDMQERIYQLCKENSERLGVVEHRLDRLETDVAEMKLDIANLKSDVKTLKSDVGTLKSDVVSLKSDMVEVKGILHKLLELQTKS